MKKGLHIIKNHVFAGLHHGVGLSDAEVEPCSVNRALALGRGLIFAGQFEMLLEITMSPTYSPQHRVFPKLEATQAREPHRQLTAASQAVAVL
jgi:hypothetical protein